MRPYGGSLRRPDGCGTMIAPDARTPRHPGRPRARRAAGGLRADNAVLRPPKKEDIYLKINNTHKRKKKKSGARKVLLLLLALLTAALLDSRYRIVTTQYSLSYADLPQSFDGLKLVQISDLHMATFGKDNGRLLSAVAAQAPDVILLTGDFLNGSKTPTDGAQTAALRPFFEKLTAIAPCYYVTGNNEWASTEMKFLSAVLKETGVTYLKNSGVLFEQNGESIVLAGVDDPNGPADQLRPDALCQKLAARYPGKFKLLLAHRNDFPAKYPALPVDLVVCGHAHGGIVRLPGLGGLFGSGYRLLPAYDAGLYHSGSYDMIVSRGLGNGKKSIPRLFNEPELVAITLHTK